MSNFITEAAVVTLAVIMLIVGVALMAGKVKLVIVRSSDAPEALPVSLEPLLLTPPKRKRGRPRKAAGDTQFKPKTRYLHLPPGMVEEDLGAVYEFFSKHKDAHGDKVVFHLTSGTGPDRSVDLPYLVRWNNNLKTKLVATLGGWS
jgi:hypothetical protein